MTEALPIKDIIVLDRNIIITQFLTSDRLNKECEEIESRLYFHRLYTITITHQSQSIL